MSAGRVQSVALRIICERDQEISAFESEEYWTLDAEMNASDPPQFRSRLFAIEGEKAKVSSEADAQHIVDNLQDATYTVSSVKKSKRRRNPSPPFITSTLQQDAARKLHFSVRRTMRVAQQLYEGLAVGDEGEVGLITYMRTDSTRISNEAIQEAQQFITETYGQDYVVSKTTIQTKKAQDAYMSISPTSPARRKWPPPLAIALSSTLIEAVCASREFGGEHHIGYRSKAAGFRATGISCAALPRCMRATERRRGTWIRKAETCRLWKRTGGAVQTLCSRHHVSGLSGAELERPRHRP